MIEKTIKDYLEEQLQITVAIQSYAGTLYDTAVLNEQVKATMENIIDRNDISKCTLNSDYNYTDTARKKYRYQAVYDIVYFKEE